VGYNNKVVLNNTESSMLDSLFTLILDSGQVTHFHSRAVSQFVTSADSIQVLQNVWATEPLVQGNNMKITTAATARSDSLVWDNRGQLAADQNLPQPRTRKVAIMNPHNNSLVCNVCPGKRTEVMALIDIGHQVRDFSKTVRSINYFVMND